MNINLKLKEIREMTETKYKEMIKMKCDKLAYKYLKRRKRSKGKEIQYTKIEMVKYLKPNE